MKKVLLQVTEDYEDEYTEDSQHGEEQEHCERGVKARVKYEPKYVRSSNVEWRVTE
jgi:hypothetical protein